MLFATPNFGSTTLGKLRSVVSRFMANPQERALRLFSADGTRIHNAIRDRVITARRRARDQYPIPFYCFWGRTDAVVNPESAVGHHGAGEPLPGDHFAVHCPASRDEPGYRRFVEALHHAHGHANIWEVERFTMAVKVTPAPPGSEVVAQHGGKQRLVVHDNVATVSRRVVFSRHNRCREPYVLKYGTRNGGWIVPRISEPHITPADKLRLYDDNGMRRLLRGRSHARRDGAARSERLQGIRSRTARLPHAPRPAERLPPRLFRGRSQRVSRGRLGHRGAAALLPSDGFRRPHAVCQARKDQSGSAAAGRRRRASGNGSSSSSAKASWTSCGR